MIHNAWQKIKTRYQWIVHRLFIKHKIENLVKIDLWSYH